jgi:hypothetical protein
MTKIVLLSLFLFVFSKEFIIINYELIIIIGVFLILYFLIKNISGMLNAVFEEHKKNVLENLQNFLNKNLVSTKNSENILIQKVEYFHNFSEICSFLLDKSSLMDQKILTQNAKNSLNKGYKNQLEQISLITNTRLGGIINNTRKTKN